MGYVKPAYVNDIQLTWDDIVLTDLSGMPLLWSPKSEFVKSLFFCLNTGMYVLTDDDDSAFVVHSADVTHFDKVPVDSSVSPDYN